MSFLGNRVLIMSYKGSNSNPKMMPGGAPQGTLLGVICFIVKFNGALLRPAIERPLIDDLRATKAKYMDDLSVAVRILSGENGENYMQRILSDLNCFTVANGMKIN